MGKKVKPNYELKAQAIEKGYDVIERKISKTKFRYYNACINECENGELVDERLQEQYQKMVKLETILANDELYKEGHKINQASYKRRNRLEKRILKWLENYNCIFVTLTFKDQVLDATTKETRRRYVTRALKQMSDKYVANIDYGRKNEREHYHAIVVSNQINNKIWSDYGAINFERIKQSSDSVKLAKYVVKLTNHAIKETTQQNRVIYSKN